MCEIAICDSFASRIQPVNICWPNNLWRRFRRTWWWWRVCCGGSDCSLPVNRRLCCRRCTLRLAGVYAPQAYQRRHHLFITRWLSDQEWCLDWIQSTGFSVSKRLSFIHFLLHESRPVFICDVSGVQCRFVCARPILLFPNIASIEIWPDRRSGCVLVVCAVFRFSEAHNPRDERFPLFCARVVRMLATYI